MQFLLILIVLLVAVLGIVWLIGRPSPENASQGPKNEADPTGRPASSLSHLPTKDDVAAWRSIFTGMMFGNKSAVERLLSNGRKQNPDKSEVVIIQIEVVRLYKDRNPGDLNLTHLRSLLREKGLMLEIDVSQI